jgi:hypothetical protein
MTGIHFESASLGMLSRPGEANSQKIFFYSPMHTYRKDTEEVAKSTKLAGT